ncbi:MAG: hypothetical protein HC904_13175 [Blastochloris sp.]|nr:hypothetical protein [Blastochloris sp.]
MPALRSHDRARDALYIIGDDRDLSSSLYPQSLLRQLLGAEEQDLPEPLPGMKLRRILGDWEWYESANPSPKPDPSKKEPRTLPPLPPMSAPADVPAVLRPSADDSEENALQGFSWEKKTKSGPAPRS